MANNGSSGVIFDVQGPLFRIKEIDSFPRQRLNMISRTRNLTISAAIISMLPLVLNARSTVEKFEDRFFITKVYHLLAHGESVDADLIGHSLSGELTKNEVAEFARLFMIARARALGIPPHKITEKLVSGDFSIYPTDRTLAFEGAGKPTYREVMEDEHNADYIKNLVKLGLAEEGKLPKETHLQGIFRTYRSEAWNNDFGSYTDIESVETIFNGQRVTVSGLDLALKRANSIGGIGFSRKFGINYKAHTRFNTEYLRIKAENPRLADELRERVMAMRNDTITQYYLLSNADRNSPVRNEQDYKKLRRDYLHNFWEKHSIGYRIEDLQESHIQELRTVLSSKQNSTYWNKNDQSILEKKFYDLVSSEEFSWNRDSFETFELDYRIYLRLKADSASEAGSDTSELIQILDAIEQAILFGSIVSEGSPWKEIQENPVKIAKREMLSITSLMTNTSSHWNQEDTSLLIGLLANLQSDPYWGNGWPQQANDSNFLDTTYAHLWHKCVDGVQNSNYVEDAISIASLIIHLSEIEDEILATAEDPIHDQWAVHNQQNIPPKTDSYTETTPVHRHLLEDDLMIWCFESYTLNLGSTVYSIFLRIKYGPDVATEFKKSYRTYLESAQAQNPIIVFIANLVGAALSPLSYFFALLTLHNHRKCVLLAIKCAIIYELIEFGIGLFGETLTFGFPGFGEVQKLLYLTLAACMITSVGAISVTHLPMDSNRRTYGFGLVGVLLGAVILWASDHIIKTVIL